VLHCHSSFATSFSCHLARCLPSTT
jgi:hypothetical protein